MSKAMFEQLGYPALSPTLMTIQLADSSIRHPEGVVESLLVNVKGSYVFVDFVVLDMQDDGGMPLILGRSFLSDVKARIDVGAGKIRFRIERKNIMFKFQTKEEQCYLVHDDVEQSREWTKPRPQPKQPLATPAKSKKTKKVWWKVEKASPSTSRE